MPLNRTRSIRNKSINIVGKRFAKLEVLEVARKHKNGTFWRCKCDCGGDTIASTTRLMSGFTVSCGCDGSMPGYELVGRRFTRLEVLERAHSRNNGLYWRCRCDCGKETFVRTTKLMKGHTRSCGCLRGFNRDTPPNQKPIGHAAQNRAWTSMIIHAAQRGYAWELTREEWYHLTQQPCVYCGARYSNLAGQKNNNGGFRYNGIDRVDNTKGYTLDNCAPCCKACNLMKQRMEADAFILQCEKIAAYQRSKVDGH